MNCSYIKHWCGVTLFSLFTLLAFGQKTVTIQLLDSDDQAPIVAALFIYDNQSGTSDESDQIRFQYQETASLQLSHLNYGNWQLSPPQV
ncbi:MAG TPA: hypothetical protein VJ953_21325 [Saprospiraceae bacterium]|nr:hypothetical protein [Saprospiraceae bacterium]